jgi:hypothetical protein
MGGFAAKVDLSKQIFSDRYRDPTNARANSPRVSVYIPR